MQAKRLSEYPLKLVDNAATSKGHPRLLDANTNLEWFVNLMQKIEVMAFWF